VQRQRELLIRLRELVGVGLKAAKSALLMQHAKIERHDLFGSRCIVLNTDWVHAVSWAHHLEHEKAAFDVDSITQVDCEVAVKRLAQKVLEF
jgi:hypothetical protein